MEEVEEREFMALTVEKSEGVMSMMFLRQKNGVVDVIEFGNVLESKDATLPAQKGGIIYTN